MSERPPMPEPMATPVLSCCSRVCGDHPACARASADAARANCTKCDSELSSPGKERAERMGENSCSASPRGTMAAIWAGIPSRDASRLTAFSPLSRRRQFTSTPTPRGVTRPTPVTRTRRILGAVNRRHQRGLV
eukprot:scaffold4659_cov125-Isochrysis_galbana.AAC.22